MVGILALIFGFFGAYGWLSGIGCGIGLLRLLPGSSLTRQGLRLFTPLWETMTLFLVFGTLALVAIFGHNLPKVIGSVKVSLIVAIAALGLRIGLVVYLWASKAKAGFTWRNLLYNGASFLVPLCLGAIGVQLMTGRTFWQTPTGWIMMAALLFGLLAMSVAFVYFIVGQTPHDRLHQLSRWLNVLLVLCIVLMLLSVNRHNDHLRSLALACLVLFGVIIALSQFLLWLGARERYMFWFVSGLALISPPLLALANQPYLAFPALPLGWAYRLSGDTLPIAVGLGAVLTLCIVGFGWLAQRMLHDTRRGR